MAAFVSKRLSFCIVKFFSKSYLRCRIEWSVSLADVLFEQIVSSSSLGFDGFYQQACFEAALGPFFAILAFALTFSALSSDWRLLDWTVGIWRGKIELIEAFYEFSLLIFRCSFTLLAPEVAGGLEYGMITCVLELLVR